MARDGPLPAARPLQASLTAQAVLIKAIPPGAGGLTATQAQELDETHAAALAAVADLKAGLHV